MRRSNGVVAFATLLVVSGCTQRGPTTADPPAHFESRRVPNVDVRFEHGMTMLIRAAEAGNVDATNGLLAAGADPNIEAENGFTALTLAISQRHVAVVKALLEGGADPNQIGAYGLAPLWWARMSQDVALVQLLKDAGARDQRKTVSHPGSSPEDRLTP
jgi:ankyrin repeat protein